MPLIIVAIGIFFLLLLVIRFKVHAFLALILVALGVGLAQGMGLEAVVSAIERGVGGTLGYLALVLGLGAMLGALIAESGAAEQITHRLIDAFGKRNIQWAIILTGFIVGVPMFYTVGFVMLIPIIFAIAASIGLPLLYVGIPMAASLSVTHGFLPPHPAPTTIAGIYDADISMTLLYGLILAVPTIIIAGLLFGRTFKNSPLTAPPKIFDLEKSTLAQQGPPPLGLSIFTALLPVILMAVAAIGKLLLEEESAGREIMSFLGNPTISLLIAVLFAIYSLGLRQGNSMADLMKSMTNSVKGIAMILLIIGAGGAFKQVLVDSGISGYIVELMKDAPLSPLLMAWMIAAALRIALGSATVAAMTAAGIVLPLIGQTDVSPELLVLATGAGSLTCSNVNDTGFWLFKEYFGLSIKDTFKSWTVMETIVSIVGLIGCLVLSLFV
jgi:gluconate transporter